MTRRRTAESALEETQSEIERQRRLYEAILTNTPDLAFVWDVNHRFTYANDGLLAMWGKTKEEAIGKNCLELGYEPWHAAMHDREIEEVIATKKPVRGEVPFTGAFGRRIYDYILVPVLGPDGTVEAVAGTTRDVTEYRLAEERLREGDRLKDEFIATLAHELRNPLSPIRTGLELIKMTSGDPAAVEKTRGMMERQVEQLVALVDDLLDVSRIAQDKLDLRREAVRVADVVQVAIETARPAIDRLGHQLTVRLPQQPITIDADPNRIAQILSNLLSNAAKYTAHGGHIQLIVEAEKQDLLVSVKDDGMGIPAEMLSRIFEMFAQVDRPLEKADAGLGIGLTLVKSLVELHGGTISAHSAGRDKGTEFKIRIPIVLEAGRPKEASQEDVGEITPSKVLVVDDNQAGAEMLTMLVQMLGSEVRTANDGQQAVDIAAEFRPDIVLMDLGMPRMDGYDAARFMRLQPWGANITLVALTGWGQDEDKQRTKEAGFDIHVVKPVNPSTLRAILNTHSSRSADY